MSDTVTLMLPKDVAQSARAVAMRTDRRVEDVLIEWLGHAAAELLVESLPDDQVIALRDQEMGEAEQAELSDLLAQQREGTLTDDGRTRLTGLMEAYRRGMVRKARALKVAVERGLQSPLDAS